MDANSVPTLQLSPAPSVPPLSVHSIDMQHHLSSSSSSSSCCGATCSYPSSSSSILPAYPTASPTPSASSITTSRHRKRRRPPHSYAVLIAQAILSSPRQRLTLREIYTWLAQRYPDLYNLKDTDWQNTIRHNLSLNKCFVKKARETKSSKKKKREPLDDVALGKGGYWVVDEEHLPAAFVPLGPHDHHHHSMVNSDHQNPYLNVPFMVQPLEEGQQSVDDQVFRKRRRSPSPMMISTLLN